MKKILLMFCCIAGMLMSSCEKDPDMGELNVNLVVYTDHDNGTDFGSFKTYFLPDSILEVGSIYASYWKDENARTLIKEVESEMNRRGYTRITDPERKDEADLGVQLSYIAQSTQVVAGWGDPFLGWWNYGFWGPWWSGWYYPYPVTYSYDTNALVMEMVDLTDKGDSNSKHQLPVVWYSSASGFKFNNSRFNMQLLLEGIDQAFTQSGYIGSEK